MRLSVSARDHVNAQPPPAVFGELSKDDANACQSAENLFGSLPKSHTERMGHTRGIFRIGLGEMAELAFDDLARHALHRIAMLFTSRI